jgi:hypothetical protein
MKTFKQFTSKMKTLYVQRKMLNGADLIAWAKKVGFDHTVPTKEMHVTCAYSKAEVDWNKVKFDTKTVIIKGGKRTLSVLGDGGAVVLKFDDAGLQKDWQYLRDAGCSWVYKTGYIPHITITYNGNGIDFSKFEPFDGPIELGLQIHSELDLDFVKKLKEA